MTRYTGRLVYCNTVYCILVHSNTLRVQLKMTEDERVFTDDDDWWRWHARPQEAWWHQVFDFIANQLLIFPLPLISTQSPLFLPFLPFLRFFPLIWSPGHQNPLPPQRFDTRTLCKPSHYRSLLFTYSTVWWRGKVRNRYHLCSEASRERLTHIHLYIPYIL